MGRTYTPEEKAHALELYVEHGPTLAAEQTGIPKATVAAWARRLGVHTKALEKTAAAVETQRARIEERKLDLAARLIDDAEWLRKQLRIPCVEQVVKTVAIGDGCSKTEIVEVHRDQPTFGDKKTIMTAIAIAVDKVQVLTGAATERIEVVGGAPPEEQIAGLRDELAERRQVA